MVGIFVCSLPQFFTSILLLNQLINGMAFSCFIETDKMRWWVLLCSVYMAACGNEPGEETASAVKETTTVVNSVSADPIDTSVTYSKNTSSHASYAAVAEIKRPSGVYQFILPYQNGEKILHTI